MDRVIKQFLDQLTLIYYGFLALPLLLFPIVYLPIKDILDTENLLNTSAGIIYSLVALLLFLLIYLSRRRYLKHLEKIASTWKIDRKLVAYRRGSIFFFALGMVVSLISVIFLMITHHQLFVATYPILLLILSLYRPTIQRLKRELPLSKEELSMIDNHGQITNNIVKHDK